MCTQTCTYHRLLLYLLKQFKMIDMTTVSIRDFRSRMADIFNRVDNNEKVVIRRRNKLYSIVEIKEENIITPELQLSIDEARKELAEGKTKHFESAAEAQKWMESL